MGYEKLYLNRFSVSITGITRTKERVREKIEEIIKSIAEVCPHPSRLSLKQEANGIRH